MNFNDWPSPKLEGAILESCKMYGVKSDLRDMQYVVNSAREAVSIIEQNNLDLSQFDFPYGSFEAFKEHTLAGEFDFDESKCISSREEIAAYKQDIKARHLWRRS